MKKNKIIFRVVTGLLSLMLLGGVSQYLFNHESVQESFTKLLFPTYLIYPMAVAKVLGVLALWFSKSKSLTDWAYAGFFFNMLLAVSAHLNVGDGEFAPAAGAIVLVVVSYIFRRKLEVAEA